MRFFSQHEARGTRQRIKARFSQCTQLELAVAIREVGEHEKRQPVRGAFIKGAQNAWIVQVTGTTLQQCFGFFSTIATKVAMQQIHHGPQMPSLFHVHLEQVAQIVKRRTGQTQMALLFHRGRFGVTLCDDDATQIGAMFARHFLPGWFTLVITKINLAFTISRGEKNTPAIIGHLHVIKMCPATGIDAHCSTQIDIGSL